MTSASRATAPMRVPVVTAITLTLTAATTATRLRGPAVVHVLRRDPTALRSGQVWRLLSPVLVQTDRSAVVVLATFVLCAAIGVFGEQVFPRGEWITLYVVGALVGHGIGEAFQPRQGGTSVAFAAILGGLAACPPARGAGAATRSDRSRPCDSARSTPARRHSRPAVPHRPCRRHDLVPAPPPSRCRSTGLHDTGVTLARGGAGDVHATGSRTLSGNPNRRRALSNTTARATSSSTSRRRASRTLFEFG